MSYVYTKMESPLGILTLVGSDNGLAAVSWENDALEHMRVQPLSEDRTYPLLLDTETQLREYFLGKRTTFSLPLDFVGTEFQISVWQALLTIPYGETRSYGHIAKQLGNAKAMRAVGAANGKNPIPIIAPCHRVIGANNQLTGFTGGLERKAYLLDLESKQKSLFSK